MMRRGQRRATASQSRRTAHAVSEIGAGRRVAGSSRSATRSPTSSASGSPSRAALRPAATASRGSVSLRPRAERTAWASAKKVTPSP